MHYVTTWFISTNHATDIRKLWKWQNHFVRSNRNIHQQSPFVFKNSELLPHTRVTWRGISTPYITLPVTLSFFKISKCQKRWLIVQKCQPAAALTRRQNRINLNGGWRLVYQIMKYKIYQKINHHPADGIWPVIKPNLNRHTPTIGRRFRKKRRLAGVLLYAFYHLVIVVREPGG